VVACVGGLSAAAWHRCHFETYGRVEDVALEGSGAVVRFATRRDAELAMHKATLLNGKTLSMVWASAPKAPPAGGAAPADAPAEGEGEGEGEGAGAEGAGVGGAEAKEAPEAELDQTLEISPDSDEEGGAAGSGEGGGGAEVEMVDA